MSIVPYNQNSLNTHDSDPIDQLINYKLATVAASSARVYEQTYKAWVDWCNNQGVNPTALQNVRLFLADQPVTKKTRQRHLNAMRGLMKAAAMMWGGDYRILYEASKDLRVPEEGVSDTERVKHVLSPKQVAKVLEAWDGETTAQRRNRALMGVLFHVGARRDEIAHIEWERIDFEEGTINIPHGKGDKERDAAVLSDETLEALLEWRSVCGDRRYAFCAIGKSGKLLADRPISGEAVRLIVMKTEKMTGIIFRPHDARRTLITEIVTNVGNLRDAQVQAGHKNPETTMLYVQKAEARLIRKRINLRY